MNLLNAAGGAMQGYVEGQQDLQQKAQFDFLQKQRARMLQQQNIEDTADAAYRGIKPAGTYTEGAQPALDLYGNADGSVSGQSPAVPGQQVTRTAQDVGRDQIAALNRGTSGQRAQAVQLQQAANQQQQFDYQQHKQHVTDTALKAAALADINPVAAMQHLASQYEAVPDGQKMLVQQGPNGQPMYGVADQSGRWVPGHEPRVITPDEVHRMTGKALMFASPEMFHMVNAANAANATAAAHGLHAEAVNTSANATAAKDLFETEGLGGQTARSVAQQKANIEAQNAASTARHVDFQVGPYGAAQIGHLNAQSAAAGAQANATRYGTIQQMQDENGNVIYGIPTLPKNGDTAPSMTQVQMPAGVKGLKMPQTMSDAEKLRATAYYKSLETDPPRNPFEADKRAALYGQPTSGGILDKLNAADPNKQKPKR